MIPTQFCGDFPKRCFSRNKVGTKKCPSSRKGIKKVSLSLTWALFGALKMSSCHVQKPRGSKFAHPSFGISVESCRWSNNPFGILEKIFLVKTFLEKNQSSFLITPLQSSISLSNKKEKNWLKWIEIIINSGETIFNFRGIRIFKTSSQALQARCSFLPSLSGTPQLRCNRLCWCIA